MNLYQRKTDGVITVFLSLILLIILSLVFTIIEGARICVARVYAERALTTAMDSVMAEYYDPLWKEYHILGLDASYGSGRIQEDIITTKLTDYMSYTLYPNRNPRDSNQRKGIELYNTTIGSLAVTDITLLTDYQGELFLHEAVEYMKYREVGNAVELLLDKMFLLEGPSKVCMIYEEKLKVEEQLVEIDKGILELMKLLDGLKTSKRGLETTKAGNLKTVPDFIKKVCIEDISMESVGINNETIFLALQDNYIAPEKDFVAIDESFIRLEEVRLKIVKKEDEIAVVEADLSKAYKELQQFNTDETDADENSEWIEGMEEQIQALESKKNGLEEQKGMLIIQQASYRSTIVSEKKEITKGIRGLIPLIEDAKTVIDKILLKVEVAAPLLETFERMLYNEKDGLDSTIFKGLKDNLEDLKRYTSADGRGYNFAEMKKMLEYDKSILQQTESILERAQQEFTQEDLDPARKSFQNAWKTLSNYQIKGLTLDYRSLVVDRSKKTDFLEAIQSSIIGGITNLVIDPNTISPAKLSDGPRPTDLVSRFQETEGIFTDFAEFINNAIKNNEISNLDNIIGSLGSKNVDFSWVENSLNSVAETLLFQEYIKEHFYTFPKEGEEMNTRKPSTLVYEQEYLLAGKMMDEKNLSSIIARIITIRMAADLVTILTNKTICNEAKAVATALVGFTGLPILITITQTLILILWSFAEALVDTCALLSGKEVSIMKKEVAIELNDLLFLTRERIKAKALTLADAQQMAMSYHNYLSIFLLFSDRINLIYRSMDLIEENLSIRYRKDFSFQSCLFGFDTEATILIKPKFTGFKFVQEYRNDTRDFESLTKAAYSY